MIHAEGYTATGVQSIVESVAVPKGSFYNHFASKDAFAAEVVDAYFDSGQLKLRERLCNDDAPPLDRLKAYFDERIDALRASGFTKGITAFSSVSVSSISSTPGASSSKIASWRPRSRGPSAKTFRLLCSVDTSSIAGRVRCCACASKKATFHLRSSKRSSSENF